MSLHKRHPEYADDPIDEETAKRIWGMLTTAGAYAFNAAHTYSYGKIAYWTMWFKIHHPAAFYAASLAKFWKDEERRMSLLRDAVRHGIDVRPPTLDSKASWHVASEDEIRGGWEQVPGIGEKIAKVIIEGGPYRTWEDLTELKGIGPKTIEKIQAFANQEDPFEILKLERAIASVTEAIVAGDLGRVPRPTCAVSEIGSVPEGARAVVLAQPVARNLRDIFETNRAKGEELDIATVKRPDLSQWVVLTVCDPEEQATFIISRFKYPDLQKRIWSMDVGSDDLVLLAGRKGSFDRNGKAGDGIIFVDQLWVIEP
jgi:DNA polymerase-3 subunit alpha